MNYTPYKKLALAVFVHFFIMFSLTYLGVFRLNDIFINLNRIYMAVAMVAPMVIVMLVIMSDMFKDKRLNTILFATFITVFIGAVWGIRSQLFVGDEQFLKSMIPHHSIAVKTCTYADIKDAEIKELCEQIINSQEEEITIMKRMLRSNEE